ncbi:MAG: hypothetical protein QJR14_04925 [Bacillota bacterium]|nr:hypothetical protein [Bacillota bacterium]
MKRRAWRVVALAGIGLALAALLSWTAIPTRVASDQLPPPFGIALTL